MKKLLDLYPIKITNTLTKKAEEFVPQIDNKALMYVCGITPYDYAHIGHGRCYVTFDVVFRLLLFLGYDVLYCRNFTDVDDKLLQKAVTLYNDAHRYPEIATKFINAFHENMATLKCLPPTFEPRVTTHIPQIINFIQALIDQDKAYIVNGDVYFSIQSFPEYGILSGRNLEDLQAGARIQVREEKQNPLDFALWKRSDVSAPGWQSPWGWGRPGWHIECSALAQQYLGITLDIHAGGMDLIFPHHENEIAQSQGLHNVLFSAYWMHVAFVRIDAEKMSKSLGNAVTLGELCNRFDPMIVRYYFLNHHYRNPLDFSAADLEAFAKSFQKLAQLFATVNAVEITVKNIDGMPLVDAVLKALCNDLNIAKCFGSIFDHIKELQEDLQQTGMLKTIMQKILGLPFELTKQPDIIITPEIQDLINQREKARADKDWAAADILRKKLHALGIEVQDKKLEK